LGCDLISDDMGQVSDKGLIAGSHDVGEISSDGIDPLRISIRGNFLGEDSYNLSFPGNELELEVECVKALTHTNNYKCPSSRTVHGEGLHSIVELECLS
jgi:hypothetical protein